MTNQLQVFLFPAIVHRAVEGRIEDQRELLLRATRFQLAIAMALCGSVAAVADVLIRTWIGTGFEEGVLTAQLLCAVVILRAWMAMPGTLLKGCGRHVFLAKVSAVTAVANVLLSVVLVNVLGIVGVALGTLVPAATIAAFVIFPVACREVELSVFEGYRQVVWPAVWPAVFVVAAMAYTRHAIPLRLIAVLALLAVGAVMYAALFVAFGLEREERQWFTHKITELWRRRSQMLAAA
jgi:O-antigen/teichoic acid export membrane protein